jgi:hypothetical protein
VDKGGEEESKEKGWKERLIKWQEESLYAEIVEDLHQKKFALYVSPQILVRVGKAWL